MHYTEQQIVQLTEPLRRALGDNICWSFDARHNAMLSEFAQNKSDPILAKLRTQLPDEWHDKSWKQLPRPLRNELAELAKLKKGQRILALSAMEHSPTIVALWWPWGHGGTYSLRLKLLNAEYQNTPESNGFGVLTWFKRLFAMS